MAVWCARRKPAGWYFRRSTGRTIVRRPRSSGGTRLVDVPASLHPVQRSVGDGDELGGGATIRRERREPDRQADGDAKSPVVAEGHRCEGVHEPLSGPFGLVVVRVGQKDRELVAAVASGDVRRAERSPDDLGGPSQDVVAEEMAEPVVDELEIVD